MENRSGLLVDACLTQANGHAERVAALMRNAEAGCYIMQTILNPTPVTREFKLNGAAFDPDSYKMK